MLCLTLCDAVDCSLPGSSIHGDSPNKNTGESFHALLQGSSQPRTQTQVSRIAGGFFTIWATREAREYWRRYPVPSPGDLPDPGIELESPALQADSLPAELLGKGLDVQYKTSASILTTLGIHHFSLCLDLARKPHHSQLYLGGRYGV